MCPQLASLCRSLCRSLYAVRCAVRYAVRAGLTLDTDRAGGLSALKFYGTVLSQNTQGQGQQPSEFDGHLWKNAEATRGRPGGHIREQSTRSMLRYAVRTGLTLEIEQEDFPAEWMIYGTVLATKYTRMVTVGGHLWKNAQASLFVGDRLATPESSRPLA